MTDQSEHSGLLNQRRRIVTIEGEGAYYWTPALQIVDFIEKGKRRSAWSATMSSSNNTHERALRIIGRHIATYMGRGD